MASRVASFMASCCFPYFSFSFLAQVVFPWVLEREARFLAICDFLFLFFLSFFGLSFFFSFFFPPKVPIMKGEQEPSEKNLLMTIHQQPKGFTQMLGGYNKVVRIR